MFRRLPPLFLIALLATAISLQSGYADRRYGERLLVPDCPWCDGRDVQREDVTFIPINSNIGRLAAPADPDFIADLLWLRTCYYFGEHVLTNRSYPYLFHFIDIITDLSPTWEIPYLFGAVLLPTEANSLDDGLSIIDKGMAFLPDSWKLPFFKAYYHWKSLNDLETAAQLLYKAATKPKAPVYLYRLSATIATQAGQRELGLHFVEEGLDNLRDDTQRDMLIKKMNEMK